MATFQPRPPGLEAPYVLPKTTAAVSAEATGLGGTDSVTLIATSSPEPVNSPSLSVSGGAASDLGTYSTTDAGSAAAAQLHVESQANLLLSSCSGPSHQLTMAGVNATSCPSSQGPTVNFTFGAWRVQLQDLEGVAVPVAQGSQLAAWLVSHSLPAASAGVVAVTVPGPGVGTATETTMVWAQGGDDYEVSGRGGPDSALQLASDMRPWPAA